MLSLFIVPKCTGAKGLIYAAGKPAQHVCVCEREREKERERERESMYMGVHVCVSERESERERERERECRALCFILQNESADDDDDEVFWPLEIRYTFFGYEEAEDTSLSCPRIQPLT